MRVLLMIVLVGACGGGGTPTSTATTCPDPDPGTLTYENFGMQFMTDYCIACHDSALTRSQRNGAPLFHDFDTLLGVLEVTGHIDQQAGSGPNADNRFMPPSQCPTTPGGALDTRCAQPSEEERQKLAEWIACEVIRPH